jgi:hypothetical protein
MRDETSHGWCEKKQPELAPAGAILSNLIVRPVRQDRGPRPVAFFSGEQPRLCGEKIAVAADGDPFCRLKVR